MTLASARGRASSAQTLRDYFDLIAPEWDNWRSRNRFYHEKVNELVAGAVVSNRRVLDIGCGKGDVLATLRPSSGLGLNVADRLTQMARERYPHLRFETFDGDALALPDDFRPDYVVAVNLLDYTYDVFELLASVRECITERTLIVLITSNPLWAPLLRLASRLGRRSPESPRNFITNRDIASILNVLGFDVVEAGLALPVPERIPILAPVLNAVLPDLPVLRYASSTQYLAARPRIARDSLSVSVVVPCHNEEGNVPACARRIPDMGVATEVIFVDDGSTDGTRAAVLAAMEEDPRVRLVAYDTNHGKANAVRAGFEAARNDVLMILDADMTVAPEDLPKFLAPLQAGTAEFVNGTRLVYPIEDQAMPTANFIGNKAFCLLVSWVLRQRVSDTLCGTKALLRRDYESMPLPGRDRWGDFDLLFGAARQKLRILEIPIHYRERVAGESKMNVRRDGPMFLGTCLQGWRMLRRPGSVPWSTRERTAGGIQELSPAGDA
ncbi:MAG: glycosyltransferase [Solirubrobacterales bacterium]|nr:glycosyltransferase [Solirubrobacterales bacterium]